MDWNAAAKSLQSSLTLRNPIDSSPPGSWDSPGKNTGVGCHFLLQDWNGQIIQMTVVSIPVGKNPLEQMEQPSQSTTESEMQYLGGISKTMILIHFQGKLFNITVTQVYAPTTDDEEAEIDRFYEDL